MAAQFEEIIIDAYALYFQDLRPELRQRVFDGIPRGNKRSLRFNDAALAWRRQSFHIDLSIGRERQFFHANKYRGHHVLRNFFLQVSSKFADIQSSVSLRFEVSNQRFVAGCVFTSRHHALSDASMFTQHCFNFAKFDAEAANLYLVIDAPEILNLAGRQVPRKISGFVQTRVFSIADYIWNKSLGGELRAVQVATGESNPANMQFASNTDWYRA